MFFITGCCAERGCNQLCLPTVGRALLDAVRFYHERQDWFVRLFLLMPDHVQALIAPAQEKSLGRLLSDWKGFAATQPGVSWQKSFFDHRLRSHESWGEKASHVRQNPVRAGLISEGEKWPYLVEN